MTTGKPLLQASFSDDFPSFEMVDKKVSLGSRVQKFFDTDFSGQQDRSLPRINSRAEKYNLGFSEETRVDDKSGDVTRTISVIDKETDPHEKKNIYLDRYSPISAEVKFPELEIKFFKPRFAGDIIWEWCAMEGSRHGSRQYREDPADAERTSRYFAGLVKDKV